MLEIITNFKSKDALINNLIGGTHPRKKKTQSKTERVIERIFACISAISFMTDRIVQLLIVVSFVCLYENELTILCLFKCCTFRRKFQLRDPRYIFFVFFFGLPHI